MMNPVPWLQMTNMISYQGLVRTFPSSHDPLYINGTLVKFAQACNNDWRTFYPISMEGTNHIIREFMRKSNVEVMTYDKSFKPLFSAKGFTKIYNEKQKEITIEKNAI